MSVTRRTLCLLALAFAAFAVYGSLIPFEFQTLTLAEAIERFRAIPYLDLDVGSRADFVANILLFVPIGVFTMGACRLDRTGVAAGVVTAFAALVAAACLAASIEFTQVFVQRRTVSLNDIAAETIGAAIGILLWVAVGDAVAGFLRMMSRDTERASTAMNLLSVYAAGFIVFQLLPFDVTIQLSELSQKYNEGRLRIVPFTFAYSSPIVMLWDYVTDALLAAPIGALAAMAWTRHRGRQSRIAAWAIATAVIALLELAQVFVFTRYADSTDVITGGLGAAAGVVIAMRWSARPVAADDAVSAPLHADWRWAVAAAVWMIVLAAYSWFPFDFHLSRDFVRDRVGAVSLAPFRNYYFGSEYHAITELARKSALTAPWGMMLALTYRSTPRTISRTLHLALAMLCATVVVGAIEVGQILLPERYPDITDVLTGVVCVWIGARLAWWAVDRRV